jgi:ubiquinone biosynthesis protein UbiJ
MESNTNNRIVQISFDASVAGTLSGSCKSVILSTTEACYINFNQDTVTVANGFYLPADSSVEVSLSKIAKIAAIKETTGGKLTILELF